MDGFPVIDRKAFSEVYEPREDSFLFLDALDSEKEFLNSVPRSVVLEVGPGSGIVSTHLSRVLGAQQHVLFFGCDINPAATRVTQQTFRVNNADKRPHSMHCVVGDLASPFLRRLAGKVTFFLKKKIFFVPFPRAVARLMCFCSTLHMSRRMLTRLVIPI